ncbi:MAG TPA: hypothetical protein VFA76_02490 [Terriglobales bacterium]|nr:hypothetical protein [Terriglobales bacterium]
MLQPKENAASTARAQHERRRMERFAVDEPATVKYWDHGPRETTATVENASPDGLCFATETDIPWQSRLELVFLFPATLRSPGVRFVCHCRPVRQKRDSEKQKFCTAVAIVRSESERLRMNDTQSSDAAEDSALVLADL